MVGPSTLADTIPADASHYMANSKIPSLDRCLAVKEELGLVAIGGQTVDILAVVASFDTSDSLPEQKNLGPSAQPSTLSIAPPAFQHVDRLSWLVLK